LITFIDHRHPRFTARYGYFGYPSGQRGTAVGPTSARLPARRPDDATNNESQSPKRCSAFPTPDGKTKTWGWECRVSSFRNLEPLAIHLSKINLNSGHPPTRTGFAGRLLHRPTERVSFEPRKQQRRLLTAAVAFSIE